MKRALLLIAHGSPQAEANAPLFQVLEVIRSRGAYPVVEAGFLECNEPTIPEAIAACVNQGADRIDAVPYFLHTGKHVAADLPTILQEARDRYPHVEFRLADYLGRSPSLTDLVARRATEAKFPTSL